MNSIKKLVWLIRVRAAHKRMWAAMAKCTAAGTASSVVDCDQPSVKETALASIHIAINAERDGCYATKIDYTTDGWRDLRKFPGFRILNKIATILRLGEYL